jgi:hypothetical protein
VTSTVTWTRDVPTSFQRARTVSFVEVDVDAVTCEFQWVPWEVAMELLAPFAVRHGGRFYIREQHYPSREWIAANSMPLREVVRLITSGPWSPKESAHRHRCPPVTAVSILGR